MKKTLLLSVIVFLISITSQAQLKKGSTMLGLDLSFSGNTSKNEYSGTEIKSSASGFNTSFLLGKAVKENLFAGGSLSFSSNTSKSGTPQVTQSGKTYGASVWIRKYFPVHGPLYAFVNGSLYSYFGNTKNSANAAVKENSFGTGIGIYPGISLQLKKSFYLDASLNNLANIYYFQSTTEQPGNSSGTTKQTNSNYGISTSLGNSSNPLQLGIRWIIPAKG